MGNLANDNFHRLRTLDVMAKPMTLNVRVGGTLSEFVAANIGEHVTYDNVSEYVRDLIRKMHSARSRRPTSTQSCH
jgi:Arc/MetJ-type ribon-helix-helix transcriptional regulator